MGNDEKGGWRGSLGGFPSHANCQTGSEPPFSAGSFPTHPLPNFFTGIQARLVRREAISTAPPASRSESEEGSGIVAVTAIPERPL